MTSRRFRVEGNLEMTCPYSITHPGSVRGPDCSRDLILECQFSVLPSCPCQMDEEEEGSCQAWARGMMLREV